MRANIHTQKHIAARSFLALELQQSKPNRIRHWGRSDRPSATSSFQKANTDGKQDHEENSVQAHNCWAGHQQFKQRPTRHLRYTAAVCTEAHTHIVNGQALDLPAKATHTSCQTYPAAAHIPASVTLLVDGCSSYIYTPKPKYMHRSTAKEMRTRETKDSVLIW
jgi:hypothetical protein